MKRVIRILLFAGFISLFSFKGFSQFSVSYYDATLPKLGVAYQFNDRLWSEFRLYGNFTIDYITPELVLCYHFINRENYRIYAGLGGVINYFNGFVVPVGLQFIPFEQFDRFSLHIELLPTVDFDSDIFIQTSWGIRYTFGITPKD